jgi:hypothetical protein
MPRIEIGQKQNFFAREILNKIGHKFSCNPRDFEPTSYYLQRTDGTDDLIVLTENGLFGSERVIGEIEKLLGIVGSLDQEAGSIFVWPGKSDAESAKVEKPKPSSILGIPYETNLEKVFPDLDRRILNPLKRYYSSWGTLYESVSAQEDPTEMLMSMRQMSTVRVNRFLVAYQNKVKELKTPKD